MRKLAASTGTRSSLTLILALAAMFVASGSADAGYVFNDLGTLGGAHSSALAINNAGQVTGWSYGANTGTVYIATRWDRGAITELSGLGGNHSVASAINNAGQVAGYAQTPRLDGHATVWTGSTPTDLGTLGGASSHARSINNAGQVAGYSDFALGSGAHATVWANGTMTDLGTLGGGWSLGNAINDPGQVAGSSLRTDNQMHAALWSGGSITDLGALGGYGSEALAINNAGQIAGWSQLAGPADPHDVRHATLWNSGAIVDLGSLGGGYSYATAINNRGLIVGWSQLTGVGGWQPPSNDTQHAFLWDGGDIVDLNSFMSADASSAGWRLISAGGINDEGEIVGQAENILTGEYHAYLLSLGNVPSAVPELGTYALMIAGLGVVGFVARRRKATE